MSVEAVAAVVVNYRSSRLIEANVGPLSSSGLHVVVVDNYSDELERRRARDLAGRYGWTLVELATNAGFGAGVNAGVRAAVELGCESFLLLNPDARVGAATVDELHQQSRRDPLALLSPRLIDGDDKVVFAGALLDLGDGRIRRWPGAGTEMARVGNHVPWLSAACLMVSRELWDRVGGFSEVYFMYWEDVDFNYRCLNAGGRVRLRTDLSAIHEGGGTQGKRRGRAKSALYYYFNCRNRLVFALRFLDRRALASWLRCTPRISWEILLQGGRRQLLHSPLRGWAAARGACAGSAWALTSLVRPRAVSRWLT